MKNIFLLICCLSTFLVMAQDIPNQDRQISQAVMAAPQDQRPDATVLGYNVNGEVVLLREGSGDLVCLANNPSASKFSVACYHKDLEPFMARGRELKAQGLDFKTIFDTREEEVKSGKLPLPQNSTLMVLSGDEDPETGFIRDAHTRYVVYIPFATGETTGLSEKPLGAGAPWLMNPGTHRAHIMITPPNP
ncbi:MAG: hypothetical protein R8G66_17285 [Cytophagales bacterium]|nr:hypothetical protein [Cytophagales bacterium]